MYKLKFYKLDMVPYKFYGIHIDTNQDKFITINNIKTKRLCVNQSNLKDFGK